MRTIPETMAARLRAGAASLCHVWVVTRADGVRLGFTDHDRALRLDGVDCAAQGGWTAGAVEGASGAGPGTATVLGALGGAILNEAEIVAGAFDGAEVALWRVDWSEPAIRVRLWVKTLTRIKREGDGFSAELEGPLARLEAVVGRVYGRDCEAALGDRRCGLSAGRIAGRTCDRRWATCRSTFDNAENFRGFPTLPGDDFLTAHPVAGGRHDGGRR